MTDLAPNARRIPVPGGSLWWLVGAGAAGIVAPAIIGAVTALAAYYPIGSALPRTILFSFTGTFFVIPLVATMSVVVGVGYSLVAWNWRPFFLSIILFGAMALGFYPGLYANGYLKGQAFQLLAARSEPLVNAIREHERVTGAPPRSLAELVPQYLPKVPHTGMSAYPRYEYASESGICPDDNAWNIAMFVGEVLNFDMFFYCPKKSYPGNVGGNGIEVMGDWAYMHE